MDTIESQLRNRIDEFVAEISALVRQAAMDAVGEALGAQGGRRMSSTISPNRVGARLEGKRQRRTVEDLERIGAQILEYVNANPGCKMEEISAALGEATKDLRRPLQDLIKARGGLESRGQRRGTTYYPADVAAPKRRKKSASRRKTRRKAG